MKRSEINNYLQQAVDFFQANHFHLPPFAFWRPEQWAKHGAAADYMRSRALGWDVTDLGSGRFEQVGAVLFSLHNGLLGDPSKIYAEKIMMIRKDQHVPFHFHFLKTEDIINRAGGDFVIELYNSDQRGQFATTEVCVRCDGLERKVPPGGRVVLKPGESITLIPGVYHSFFAVGGHAMVGEVSSVNDDKTDNRHHEPLSRFSKITEDEPPLYPLCNDYMT